MRDACPSNLDQVLSPGWLSDALSSPSERVEVSEVKIVETLKTMATKVRFEVTYRSAPRVLGRNFCVKGFFGEPDQIRQSSSSARAEASYYRDFAPRSKVRVPTCRYIGFSSITGQALIVMDDVVAAGGHFLSALSPYTPEQAAASLDQLALLHAEHWGGPNTEDFAWLTKRLEGIAKVSYLPVPAIQELMNGARGDPLRPEIKDAARIYRGLQTLVRIDKNETTCLVHGDAHAGNIFELDGAPALIDWQVVQRANWALDVAYHIASTLTVEERRRSEQPLLRHYLERLRGYGVAAPPWDGAWLAYRRHLIYGYYLWALTRRVDPPIIVEFVKRLGLAVTEHGTFGLLESAGGEA